MNWSPQPYPNVSTDNVLINALGVNLDVTVTIGSLTLANGAAVNMQAGTTLNLSGSLSDNGDIVVNSNQSSTFTALNFSGGVVSGTGDISLDYYGNDAQVDGTLTQGAGHTISGFGEINAALTNNGVVNASYNGQTLYLATNNMVNNNLMESSGGGLLDIEGITISQGAAGQLLANGGNIQFENGTTISGGALNSSANGGVFILSRSAGATFNSLTNNATVDMGGHSTLNVTGTLTDNGAIVVNNTQDSVGTKLNFSGATVTGTGDISLDYYGNNAQVDGTLTQGAGHTISGFGEINAALTNNGVVNASYNGPTLYLATNNMVNNNIMESSGGGLLDIEGITVTQGTNGQLLAAGNNNVQFEDGTKINGGALNSSGNGGVFVLNNSAAVTFNSLTNNATVDMDGHSTLNVTGSLTDNGVIVVNNTQDAVGTKLNFSGATVTGTGDISLDYYGNDAQVDGTLTQGAGHTISGFGEINAALTNNGVVNASYNGQTLYLATNNMVNNNIMESSGGGLLDIEGISITQGAAGQLLANGGNIQFENGTTISGGALNSSANGGVFILSRSAGATFNSLTNNATVDMGGHSTLNVTGTLTDNGVIVVNNTQDAMGTKLNFSGATVTGTGDISLDYYGNDAQVDGTLTQGAGHTISGFGEINAALTNNGVVNASYNGQTLYLATNNMVNNNIMESSGGGLLDIEGITVTQGPKGQLLANGGNVQFEDGTVINGGALNSSTNGGVFILNNSATATFNSLTNNATVDMIYASTLNITGPFIDNGGIVVQSTQGNFDTVLNFSGVTVTGTGDISLNYYGAEALVSGTLSQGAGHTISGFGEINAALTNNGVVNASYNGQTLYLATNNMVNNNIMESSGGGLLDIEGITVTQGPKGQLLANGGNVQFEDGTVINGGALNSSTNGGVFILNNSATATFNSLTNNATVDMIYASTLNITGPFIDNGGIVVQSTQGNFDTVLNFSGVTVTGTGDISLNYYGAEALVSGTLSQGAGHTISGFGEINAALTNNGVVNASYNGQTLYLATNNMVNNNIMESSNGGLLDIQGITITQGANGQLLANGGNVQFEDGTVINGGALNSSTNGGVFILNNSAAATFNSLTNNATVDMIYASTLNITGPFIDNGGIVVQSTQGNFDTVLNFSGVTVTGTGDISLDYYGDYAQVDGTLTQGAGHTISGFGEINAALINNGTVTASYGGQNLYVNGLTTNNGLMEASNGGTLVFTAGVLTNLSGTTLSGGTYEAGANSTIDLPGSVITNDATVILNGGGSTFAAINPLAVNNGEFEVLGGQTFATAGNFVNSGIVVAGGSGSLITFTGTATNNGYVQATGQGTLTFASGLTNLAGTTLTGGSYEADAGSTINLSGSIVTNNATVILSGSGSTFTPINALAVNNGEFEVLGGRIFATAGNFVNSGTVVAGGAGSLISFTGAATNNGYMQATGGGTLEFAPGLLTNLSGTTLTGGTYEADAGGTISLTGSIATNAATVILNGAGSTFKAMNALTVNDDEFEVLGGATFTSTGGLTNYGTLAVSGPGSVMTVSGLLAEDGTASLAITGGGVVSDVSGELGNLAGANSTATVSGPGSAWKSTNNFFVGYSGTGTLTISGSGAVTDGYAYVGYGTGSKGTVTVSGTGSKWVTANTLTIGDLGSGTVILNGGLLSAASVTGGGGAGVFDFNGGTLQATGASGAFLTALNTVNVQAGGAIINSNGFAITIPQPLLHDTTSGAPALDGGLTKTGAGTLTLAGSNTYTGPTDVTAGTLAITGKINSPASNFTVDGSGASATLSGSLYASNTYVGVNGTSSFTQTGGTQVIGNYLYLGENAGSSGAYNLSGGTLQSLYTSVGYYGSGAFTQSGGTDNVTGHLIVGRFAGGNDTYNLSAGLLESPTVYVGYTGSGNFIQTGGTNAAGALVLGESAGGRGTYLLNGGLLSTASVSGGGGTSVFDFNGGTLQATGASSTFLTALNTVNVQAGGAIINSNGFAITIAQPLLHDTTSGAPALDGGLTKTGAGTLTLAGSNTYTGPTDVTAGTLAITGKINSPASNFTVDGSSASATLSGSLYASNTYVGVSGSGTFTQSGGTQVIGNYLYLGENAGSTGAYNLSGGTLQSLYASVGYYGTGTFTQSGGTDNATSHLIVGRFAGGNDTYNLSAGLLESPTVYVGYTGSGNFIQTGGTNAAGALVLGESAGGRGTYLLNGGLLSTASVSGGGGTSVFDFNGGTLQATGASSTFLTALNTVNVQAGGAIINSNGFAITIPQPLLHDTTSGAPALDGGLTKTGAGTLTLSASSTYTGATKVTSGVLNVSASGAVSKTASASVASGAALEVDGVLNAAATSTVGGTLRGQGSVGAIGVQSGGTLAPGLSSFSSAAGVLTANGNVSLTDNTSTFSIRLGVAMASDHDELTLDSGNVTLNGATLKLTLGGAYATQPAGTIDVIINGLPADSTITGEFAQGTSITASNGDPFDIVYGENATDTGAGNDVLLVATDPPTPPVAERDDFARPALKTSAVPEPGTWAMLLGGFGTLGICRFARRRKHGLRTLEDGSRSQPQTKAAGAG